MKIKKIVLILLFSFTCSTFALIPGKDRYELSLGGDVPFYTGMHLRYNWSTQYYTKLGAGFALELFMENYHKALKEVGMIQHDRLLVSSFANSVVFDLRLGWSMSIYEGPYVELGYGAMLWGKGEVLGRDLNNSIRSQRDLSDDTAYRVEIVNHGPNFHIGYRFVLIDKLTLNMDFGVYKPLFSKTNLNYGDVGVSAGDSQKVDKIVMRQLWFLSLGVWLGLSF